MWIGIRVTPKGPLTSQVLKGPSVAFKKQVLYYLDGKSTEFQRPRLSLLQHCLYKSFCFLYLV